MAKFPFQLLVKGASSKNKEESLTCTALLRVIPGRREVYDALWDGRSVIVKVFSDGISGKRHLKREWRGLSFLQKRGLSSPELLFTGRTEDGRWVIVAGKISDASTVLDALGETADATRKRVLLVMVCKELAKQHSKGVLQKDLHLGNFLLGGDRVFALDVGQMRFSSREVTRKKGISELALLVSCLPASVTAPIVGFCEEYFKVRGWHFEGADEALFRRQLTVHRKRAIGKGLKKSLRTSKRYLRIKAGGYLAVFDKSFCQGAEPVDFIKQIDVLMDAGKILKSGGTSYVSCVRWNSKDIVVKRYNNKGFIHSLHHTIKRSRARRGWLHAHRLGMLNIATPRPLAYIEQRKGLLAWKSYLVTEYVKGQRLYDFLRGSKTSDEECSKVTDQVKDLFDKLDKYRITHGDLKHSNILITENGPVLTDLDGMKAHKWKLLFKAKQAKDLERFTQRTVNCSAMEPD